MMKGNYNHLYDTGTNEDLNIQNWQTHERFRKFMRIYRPVGWIFVIASFLYILHDFITTGYLPPFSLVPLLFISTPIAVIIVILIKKVFKNQK